MIGRVEFPVDWKGIDKFEKQNPYKINVFEYEGKPNPVRIGESHGSNVINLLLISNGETNHYCWIKNISRLISSQVNKNGHEREYCLRCMNSFASKASLKDHLAICSDHDAVRMEMPVDKDGNPWKISFIHFFKKMRVPFMVYADFECFTESISTCPPDDRRSYTNQYQKYKPSGFCYLIKCFDDNIFTPKLVKYTAESSDDVSQRFVELLETDLKKIYERFLNVNKKMVITAEDLNAYENATHCHICEGVLGKEGVRDHFHLTGRFRGAAHEMD